MSDHAIAAFPPHAIAIIGLAGRFPGARTLDEFWHNIRSGVESLETFSDADLDAAGITAALRNHSLYVRRGTLLDGADLFDASFFGFSPREAQILDPQHRVFLECAWEALEHAGQTIDDRTSIGVYAGASMNTYLIAEIMRDPGLMDAVGGYQLMLSNDKDFLCTRVSYKLDLRGPSVTIQTACSTSLVAVEMACRALQMGECDVALAGGVSITFPQRSGYLYQDGMILSPDGHCRPFDAAAAGTRGGAGAGIVVLKRLRNALADRDTIHAVIRGAAINNDGAAKAGYTAPSVDGQAEVIATAQALAGIDARSIAYVEAHGTATAQGDPIEIAALTQVFRGSTDDVGFCRLGSLKANLGHLDAAAGVAGLIKTVLALGRREFPPLANFRSPNPQLDLPRSPFTASSEWAVWPAADTPRRAGVSSFGIGGTNAHVVVEEAPPAPASVAVRDDHLLVLSTRTATALEQATANLAVCLQQQPELSLADVAWTLQVGRKDFAHRRAVVVQDREQAVRALRQPTQMPVVSAVHGGGARPVAFMFSGQGSQHAGMGAGLYRTEPIYRDALDRCAAALQPELGRDIRDIICKDEHRAALDQTCLTQPALFCTEYALAMLWMHWGITPRTMIGHSIGEYIAAHLSGVLSLEDALRVVAARGRLMQALPPGTMAAVYLSDRDLQPRLAPGVEIAAVNGPELCSIAGPDHAIATTIEALEADGVDCRVLHTSHAFHSAMMEPACAPFQAVLKDVKLSPPTLPYVSNVTGTWITTEQATSPAYYARHLRQAVQFADGIRTLASDPNLFYLEVGPGNALATLLHANLAGDHTRLIASSLSHPRRADRDSRSMLDAAGRMWVAGVPMAWPEMLAGATPRRIPLPTYPFERKRYMVEGRSPHQLRQPTGDLGVRADGEVQMYLPAWTRHPLTTWTSPQVAGCWLVLGDFGALTTAVAAQLRAAGAQTALLTVADEFAQPTADWFHVRPGNANDMETVVHDAASRRGPIAGAVLLWTAAGDAAEGKNPRSLGYDTLVSFAGALVTCEPDAAVRVIVVTAGAQSVIDEKVCNPASALTFGPILVLPAEIQGLDIRSVDIAAEGAATTIDASARSIVIEAASPANDHFVAYRRGHRWVRRYEPVDRSTVDTTRLPLRQRSCYLITGGLGGIGLQLAHWLAGEASARLLLTARRPLPLQDDWDALLTRADADDWRVQAIRSIRAIEDAGGEVMTAVADVADRQAMAQAIAAAQVRWGPLDGVIHAAGIAGNGAIAIRQNADEVDSVVVPKVDGLAVLVELLGDVPLDFVALMSSINSVISTPGGCDYAGANAVLDAFVESEAVPAAWRRVVSINWGPWRDAGMAARQIARPSRRDQREAFHRIAMTSETAVAAFAGILASAHPRLVVTGYDLHRTVSLAMQDRRQDDAFRVEGATDSVSPTTDASARPQLSSGYEPPETDIERCLAEIWRELMGVTTVGIHDDFFELGGHSLLATRVLARVSASLGVRLALRDIFEAPTIRRLAERIDAVAADREEILI